MENGEWRMEDGEWRMEKAGEQPGEWGWRVRRTGIDADMEEGIEQEHTDVRSSNQLEIAASEFECQGLELDWIGVCWGGDFTYDATNHHWAFRYFSGSRWGNLRNEIDRQYLLNTYRVLLTRARRGLVLWIPSGDVTDESRPPIPFNTTADYLLRCGVPLI